VDRIFISDSSVGMARVDAVGAIDAVGGRSRTTRGAGSWNR
jgi:hypothetical protein